MTDGVKSAGLIAAVGTGVSSGAGEEDGGDDGNGETRDGDVLGGVVVAQPARTFAATNAVTAHGPILGRSGSTFRGTSAGRATGPPV